MYLGFETMVAVKEQQEKGLQSKTAHLHVLYNADANTSDEHMLELRHGKGFVRATNKPQTKAKMTDLCVSTK